MFDVRQGEVDFLMIIIELSAGCVRDTAEITEEEGDRARGGYGRLERRPSSLFAAVYVFGFCHRRCIEVSDDVVEGRV